MDEFVKRIREIVEGYGGQKAFAEATGMRRERICAWCNGRAMPDAASIIKLSVFCGLSTDYLLGLADKPEESDKLDKPDKPKETKTQSGWLDYLYQY